jgi:uncharacterized protein YndB with AHSA1/START domain
VNETLRAESGHQVLRIKWRLAHPPEKVWRAITEPAELSQWYPATATKLELRVGGAMVFDYGEGTVSDAVVTELDPPHVFAFRETPPEVMVRERASTIRFELHPDGAGCLLLFTQFFHDRPAAASYATGWRCCLHMLETMLDGNPIIPHPSIQVEEHQRFVAEFGLDAGSVEDTGDGWRVRFERQLMRQPGGVVWAELVGGVGEPAMGAPPPAGFTVAELPAGVVTELVAPTVLEYSWQGSCRVRWELATGPGGARIVLTQTGTDEQERDIALTMWRDRIEALVDGLCRAAD